MIAEERASPGIATGRRRGAYPVYLNGELRRTGWWYYYLLTLVYKVPEGTWLLVVLIAGDRSGSSAGRERAGPTRSPSGPCRW